MAKTDLASFTDLQDECVETLLVNDRNVFVKIKTSDYANFILFSAGLSGESSRSLDRVSFNVRTTDIETGERHPYFEHRRPTELAARAIRHFEQSFQINALDFAWTRVFGPPEGPSDNYMAYINTLNRFKESMPIEDARRKAILATWTIQRIAIPNGFTYLGEVREVIEKIDGIDSLEEVRGTMLRA